MHQNFIDGAVAALFALVGGHPARPLGLGIMAQQLFPPGRIRRDASRAGARVALEDGRSILSFHPALHGAELSRALARALAGWFGDARRLRIDRCAFADALMVPTPALFIASRMLGYEARQIADLFCVPVDVVALRMRTVFVSRSGQYLRIA